MSAQAALTLTGVSKLFEETRAMVKKFGKLAVLLLIEDFIRGHEDDMIGIINDIFNDSFGVNIRE